MNISAVINTYNAGEHLEKVLEALKSFDEIVVCDMESTDNTLDIVRRFGCKIVTFPRNNSNICEPARDFAIHSASNPWVLVVDADEIVPPSPKEYLYSRVADPAFNAALLIPRLNCFMGRHIHGLPDYQLRFFPRDTTIWPPTIHSRPKVQVPIEKIPASRKDLYLVHLDDSPVSDRMAKLNRYTDNELSRRVSRRFSAPAMLFRPVWFFIRSFFMGGTWREGRRGIAKAYLDTIYQMMLICKITERDITGSPAHTGSPTGYINNNTPNNR